MSRTQVMDVLVSLTLGIAVIGTSSWWWGQTQQHMRTHFSAHAFAQRVSMGVLPTSLTVNARTCTSYWDENRYRLSCQSVGELAR